MARVIGIGHQDFEQLVISDGFYVDKTMFIREWWESRDVVTLFTRPRRFGTRWNMSRLAKFLSGRYSGRGRLLSGLFIWKDEKYRRLQGTYPVIVLSFANVKETSYENARKKICQILTNPSAMSLFIPVL